MAVRIKKGNSLDQVNLTPMIDMVFLLLIFFIVSTRFDEEERSLPVQLPQASEAMPVTAKPRELVVNLNERGQYFIGQQQLDDVQLEAALRQAAANNPGRQTVVIRADRRCPWQFVGNVMNLCNRCNIRDYRPAFEGPST